MAQENSRLLQCGRVWHVVQTQSKMCDAFVRDQAENYFHLQQTEVENHTSTYLDPLCK